MPALSFHFRMVALGRWSSAPLALSPLLFTSAFGRRCAAQRRREALERRAAVVYVCCARPAVLVDEGRSLGADVALAYARAAIWARAA